MIGDDRHHVIADARRRAVEGVRDTATNLVGLVVVQTESRPHRLSRAHLVGDETSSISRNGARLRDRRLEIPAERDGEDQPRRTACADLDRLRQNDGDRGVEHTVVDP